MTAILFDMDDTLYDQLVPFQQAFDTLFPDTKLPLNKVFPVYRMYSDQVFPQVQAKQMTETDMYIYRVTKALADFDLSVTPEQALAFQEAYITALSQIQMTTDAAIALDMCHTHGIQTALITNGPGAYQRRKIQQLQLEKWFPENRWFISGEVGYAKPDPRIFQHAASQLSLIPERTYYVGDSYTNDVIGAKKVGWHTVFINRHNTDLTTKDILPDYEVNAHQTLQSVISNILGHK